MFCHFFIKKIQARDRQCGGKQQGKGEKRKRQGGIKRKINMDDLLYRPYLMYKGG